MKPKAGSMVLVEWIDSANHTIGWQDNDKKHQMAKIHTIGYVTKSDKHGVTLVQSVGIKDAGKGMVCNGISIPRGCILQVIKLKVKTNG